MEKIRAIYHKVNLLFFLLSLIPLCIELNEMERNDAARDKNQQQEKAVEKYFPWLNE